MHDAPSVLSEPELYERDYYTWTQRQAAALRELEGQARLDAANLAEEVADLGRSELHKVESHLRQLLVHLIKAAWIDRDELRAGWLDEADLHNEDALQAFTPGMRQQLDLSVIWDRAWRLADRQLQRHGDPALPARRSCPFDLETLLDPAFEPEPAAETLRRRLRA